MLTEYLSDAPVKSQVEELTLTQQPNKNFWDPGIFGATNLGMTMSNLSCFKLNSGVNWMHMFHSNFDTFY